MKNTDRNLMTLLNDESGQSTIEWTLLIVAFVIPTVWLLNLLLSVLVTYYRTVTLFEVLPFP